MARKLPEPDEYGNYTEKQLKRFTTYAWSYCTWFLQKKDYTIKELRDKMKRKQIPEDIIESTLQELIERRYLDDDAYTENFVYSKRKHEKLGENAIRSKLALKGIDNAIIDKHLDLIEDEELEETALLLAEKRARTTTIRKEPDRQKKVQKIASFLAYRGYNGSIAYTIAQQALDNVENEVN